MCCMPINMPFSCRIKPDDLHLLFQTVNMDFFAHCRLQLHAPIDIGTAFQYAIVVVNIMNKAKRPVVSTI